MLGTENATYDYKILLKVLIFKVLYNIMSWNCTNQHCLLDWNTCTWKVLLYWTCQTFDLQTLAYLI